jgi:hypothetical protein
VIVADTDFDGRPDTWIRDTDHGGRADLLDIAATAGGVTDPAAGDADSDRTIGTIVQPDRRINPDAG